MGRLHKIRPEWSKSGQFDKAFRDVNHLPLTQAQKRVLALLCSCHNDEKGYGWMSKPEIASALELDLSTVKAAIKAMDGIYFKSARTTRKNGSTGNTEYTIKWSKVRPTAWADEQERRAEAAEKAAKEAAIDAAVNVVRFPNEELERAGKRAEEQIEIMRNLGKALKVDKAALEALIAASAGAAVAAQWRSTLVDEAIEFISREKTEETTPAATRASA